MKQAIDWNLVSGGPSRKLLKPEHFIDGPTVTVNRALDITAQGLEVNFAAFADGPKVWMVCNLEQYWQPGITLWLTQRQTLREIELPNGAGKAKVPGETFSALWHKVLPCSVGYRYMPFGPVEDWKDNKITRAAFTGLCAFMGILHYKPRKVRILSMEMSGGWVDGKTEEESAAMDGERSEGLKTLNRWKHEQATMTKAIKAAREKGIEVELYVPQEDGSLSCVILD